MWGGGGRRGKGKKEEQMGRKRRGPSPPRARAWPVCPRPGHSATRRAQIHPPHAATLSAHALELSPPVDSFLPLPHSVASVPPTSSSAARALLRTRTRPSPACPPRARFSCLSSSAELVSCPSVACQIQVPRMNVCHSARLVFCFSGPRPAGHDERQPAGLACCRLPSAASTSTRRRTTRCDCSSSRSRPSCALTHGRLGGLERRRR